MKLRQGAVVTAAERISLKATITGWRPKSKFYSLNARASHWARSKRAATAKDKVGDALMAAGWPHELPAGKRFVLTFRVQQTSGTLPDDDNMAGCLKSCRDAIAAWLGTHDGPSGPIAWRYLSSIGPVDRVVMTLEEAC